MTALCATLLLAAVAACVLGPVRRPQRLLAALVRSEEGVAYTLPFVILIPLYMLIVLTVFQVAFLLLGKAGSMYAAHAGARAAVVWSSAQPAGMRQERIRQAVWTAMAPFVGGNASDLATAGPPPADASAHAADFVTSYLAYSSKSLATNSAWVHGHSRGNVSATSLTSKYLCAAARTTVDVQVDSSRPDGEVTVKVTYRAPLLIPVVARMLSPNGGPPYEYPTISIASMPNEAPVSDNRTLGIDYRSP
jgi:Flp pilus assembly protein TadG